MDTDAFLRSFTEPWRASALASLAAHLLRRFGVRPPRPEDLSRRLRSIREMEFVREIQEIYRISRRNVVVPARMHLEGGCLRLSGIRSRSDIVGALADVAAGWLPTDAGIDWSDAVFRVFMSDTPSEARTYLERRGIPWTPPAARRPEGEPDEVETALEALGPLFHAMVPDGPPSPVPATPNETTTRPKEPAPARPLPELTAVRPVLLTAPSGGLPPRTGTGGRGGGWGNEGPRNEAQDRAVGLRGEELVLLAERERVRAMGFPEDRVIWTSRADPLADHDILSVAPDGAPLWIEVKSTTGHDGRFRWSRAEFELAARARERYVLYRVYNAASTAPSIRPFPNPVTLLLGDGIRLDIATLYAEVAAL